MTNRTTESGIGDVVAAATYNAIDGGDNSCIVDVTGHVEHLPAHSPS